jgi:transposase
VVADGQGVPLACRTQSASPAEVTLVAGVLADVPTAEEPTPMIAWLSSFRRIMVRHEYYGFIYQGFIHLACILICLRRF